MIIHSKIQLYNSLLTRQGAVKSVLGVDRVIPGGRHEIHVCEKKNKFSINTAYGGNSDFRACWQTSADLFLLRSCICCIRVIVMHVYGCH